MDVHDATKHYTNGPEAFLVTLLGEYKDAQKRFEHIYREISDLIMPPLEFMFDSEIRDRLLFEDKDFTFSRRYFWAYQVSPVQRRWSSVELVCGFITSTKHVSWYDTLGGRHCAGQGSRGF